MEELFERSPVHQTMVITLTPIDSFGFINYVWKCVCGYMGGDETMTRAEVEAEAFAHEDEFAQ